MSRIMFFCIPAHGHTNPTLLVVAELVRRSHQVRYYSFHEFEEKITATGAQFIACDDYLPPVSQKEMQKLMKVSITQNDNDTNTIVYTSKQFQPCADTFSERYAFIGPAVKDTPVRRTPGQKPLVYISLGTVINNRPDFYKSCIAALETMAVEVLISCGKYMDPAKLGNLPSGVTACPYVDQMEVLSRANVFITHCGMNSVSESLYMGVPMVLTPQTGEEFAVARRTEEVGAGKMLPGGSPDEIRAAVSSVLGEPCYAEAAARMRADFLSCSGAAGGADFIESVI